MALHTSTTTPYPVLHHDKHPNNLSAAEETHLQALLTAKLAAIPQFHLPTLSLSSLLTQSPNTLHIPHTPQDLQLGFFLRHRAAIDAYAGQAVKDASKQDIDITRAIWFYRTDERRQWVRYHDTLRWNLAIFTALLAAHETSGASAGANEHKSNKNKSNKSKSTAKASLGLITPSALRFITAYLAAVLEHHNTPSTVFTAREAFVRKWKNGKCDVFTVFSGAQKKALKARMKGLAKEWEVELGAAVERLGREAFERRVAGFVGCLVPGRRDEGVGVCVGMGGGGGVRGMDVDVKNEDVDVKDEDIKDADVDVKDEVDTDSTNELLDALRVPFTSKVKKEKTQPQAYVLNCADDDKETVTDVRQAIAAVLEMRPRDILPVLMRVFGEDE